VKVISAKGPNIVNTFVIRTSSTNLVFPAAASTPKIHLQVLHVRTPGLPGIEERNNSRPNKRIEVYRSNNLVVALSLS
jgi:hypothetical protein